MTNRRTYEYHPRKPHALFDTLRQRHRLKTDRQLSDMLEIEQSVISRIRAGTITMSPAVILAIHEIDGMPIADIKAMLSSHQA